MFHRWYFEVEITQLAPKTNRQPHFRVGWAHVSHFNPRPTSNSLITTSGGVGDDMFSLGYDGLNFWVGGHKLEPFWEQDSGRRLRRQQSIQGDEPQLIYNPISVGDVIGCCLDLEVGVAWFTVNGNMVPGKLQFSQWKENITPAISFSAGVRLVVAI